jgi:hypothetical protein
VDPNADDEPNGLGVAFANAPKPDGRGASESIGVAGASAASDEADMLGCVMAVSGALVSSVMATLRTACIEEAAASEAAGGAYAVPLPLTTCHAWSVPSLRYAKRSGGGGSSDEAPEADVCENGFVEDASTCRPTRTVSSILASRGRDGVDDSSKDRFRHWPAAATFSASRTHPMTPMSDEVLSATTRRHSAGSQSRSTATNAPGGRRPGKGWYGAFMRV